jgi:pyruvate/2-oxoglutarate dehydrogenase complex dihydrolipoamide dehydrogenase (E3) component
MFDVDLDLLPACRPMSPACAIVEKGDPGGVLLNIGCIPARTLLPLPASMRRERSTGSWSPSASGQAIHAWTN